MKNLSQSNIKNLVFLGLVPGYQGSSNKSTPEVAASAIAAVVDRRVYPSVCIYHTDWGCPVGGEPVGAFEVIFDGGAEELEKLDGYRRAFQQSTLSVPMKEGEETIGFIAEVEGDLSTVGRKWQHAAAVAMEAGHPYVSCGIAEIADGRLLVEAEANPEFVQNLDEWEKTAKQICCEIGVEPQFFEVGFNYLKD